MKKFMMMMAMMMTIVTSAKAITYSQARTEALFLTDKMAYELRLSNAQYDAVYEINLDYLLTVAVRDDLYGTAWARRNSDLRFVLTVYQYETYQDTQYFYRPLYWSNNMFTYRIYGMYRDRTRFYVEYRPIGLNDYRGGHNIGKASYYANREFNKPMNVHPAMTGKPKPTWHSVQPVPPTPPVATKNHSGVKTNPPTSSRPSSNNATWRNTNSSTQRNMTAPKTSPAPTNRSTNSQSTGNSQSGQRKGHFGGKR